MLELTRNLVMEKFCVNHGYPSNSSVLYGDTDSVMIRFGVKNIEEAI